MSPSAVQRDRSAWYDGVAPTGPNDLALIDKYCDLKTIWTAYK
jgi:hypothetical protein